MKTPALPIVALFFAGLAIAGVAAVAMDQVGIRDKEITSLKQKLEEQRKERQGILVELEQIKTRSAEIEAKQAELVSAAQRVHAASDRQSKAAVEALELAGQATRVAQTSPARPQASKPLADYPAWYPPAPSVARKTILDNALAEHPGNASAANYEIERQTQALAKIEGWHKTADPKIKALIAKAAFEHGADYSGLAYEVEREMEAAQKLKQR